MIETSTKSRMISFRLPKEAYDKIRKALECPTNSNTSVGDYCKEVVIRHAFRHDSRKYKRRLL